MNLFETLMALDRALFLDLNGVHSPFWDGFMWIFTQKLIWGPLVIALVYSFFKSRHREGILIIVSMALVILMADQISSSIFKDFFGRLRPARDPDLLGQVHTLFNYHGGRYGFVSSHAANSFGLAFFLALLVRSGWFSLMMFLWAGMNAYTRIYLGVHFPGDILCGALIGLFCGWAGYKIFIWMRRQIPQLSYGDPHNFRVKNWKSHEETRTGFTGSSLRFVAFTLFVTVWAIAFFSKVLNGLL